MTSGKLLNSETLIVANTKTDSLTKPFAFFEDPAIVNSASVTSPDSSIVPDDQANVFIPDPSLVAAPGTWPKSLTLYSWNINGLRAVLRKGSFQEFLAKKAPDVLCLQEIKTRPEQLDAQDLAMLESTYQIFWHPAKRPGYSGTAVLIRRSLPFFVTALEPEFDLLAEEGRIQILQFSLPRAKTPLFILVNVYTPNSKADLTRLKLREQAWDPQFLKLLKRLEAVAPVITCGDFNAAHQDIDLARPAQNHHLAGFTDQERQGITNYLAAGFLDTFRSLNGDQIQYTWWSNRGRARANNVGWRIDYFFASANLHTRLLNALIHEQVLGSDHCPISLQLLIKP